MSAHADLRTYWIQTISPLHVGAGRGVGAIDLPLIRERATGWPYVPGSAVKGVLRDHFERVHGEHSPLIRAAFGRQDESGSGDSSAGSLVFADARIVALPVRSFSGTFAWCTSPLALRRVVDDAKSAALTDVPKPLPSLPAAAILVSGEPKSALPTATGQGGGKVYLDDLDLSPDAARAKDADAWAKWLADRVIGSDAAERKLFHERFAIVSDDVFAFLCSTATEIVARVAIDDSVKIVKDGALWYEESLPPEAILSGIVWRDRVFGKGESGLSGAELSKTFLDAELPALQIGGKASVGKGRVHLSIDRAAPHSASEGGKSHG
ncbi:MAG TPA: type III-B CRISPR module RAMP protein Cmr4 [Phycisphaerales bacterium]|nr:type III-B CRISPR module RAMP protein Cmr4 [Phycisphaerales bacterium]HMP38563.1 type III-B CRISPR module RAMP protein Cmr4 [Phycisphaerales bacterium]